MNGFSLHIEPSSYIVSGQRLAPDASERSSQNHDEVMSIGELEHICECFLNP